MVDKIIKYYKRRKLLKRYAEKPINPNFYGIVDVMAIQPMTAPVSGSLFHIDFVYGEKEVEANEVLQNIDKLIECLDEKSI